MKHVLTSRSAQRAPQLARGPAPSTRACAPPTSRALVHANAHTHNTKLPSRAPLSTRFAVQCYTYNFTSVQLCINVCVGNTGVDVQELFCFSYEIGMFILKLPGGFTRNYLVRSGKYSRKWNITTSVYWALPRLALYVNGLSSVAGAHVFIKCRHL